MMRVCESFRGRHWLNRLALVLVVVPTALNAQFLRKSPSPTAQDTVVSIGSPRVSLQNFLRLANAGDWEGASAYLAMTRDEQDRAEQLARRLKIVIDQRLALNLGAVSPLAVGDMTDGDADGDRIGVVVGPTGREAPVRLVRVDGSGQTHWVFSQATVDDIDRWYDALGYPVLRERLPPALMQEGPLHLYYWQWIGLLLTMPVLFFIAWLVSALTHSLLRRAVLRTDTDWDDVLLEHLESPFRLFVGAIAASPLLGFLELNARAAEFVGDATRGLVLLSMFWGLLRVIRIGQHRLEHSVWDPDEGARARTLVPLLGNLLRITVIIVATLVALAQFGYPVGTLLAGLGIGGIAVALAAQKTVEHLFGSVSLAADRAFRVGDWVRAGTTEGAVERIGLRSTSFRTHDRTVVRIPNGRLADERIETFGERDRMMLRTNIDVTYDTSPDTLDRIRDDLEATIRKHPLHWPGMVRVNVVAFADSSIRLDVLAWFLAPTWDEFLRIRHNMLLEFIRVVERHGSSFAFPSRTVYYANSDPGDLTSPQDMESPTPSGSPTPDVG